MKIMFIESKLKNIDFNLDKKEISKLPKKICLFYSIQYRDLASSIKAQLLKAKVTVSKFEQVLGCSKFNTNKDKLPILLIGSGRFHAINLYSQFDEIYLLESKKIVKISKKEIEEVRARRRGALINFLSADRIGILVSTKPGQENMTQAEELKKKLKKKGKQVYVFVSNNIDMNQFENFNIQSWINTACSGLANDSSKIINFNELPNF